MPHWPAHNSTQRCIKGHYRVKICEKWAVNIEVNRSAEGVERYFDRELAVSDYLMKEPGVWAGRGADRLGLRGPVERTQFVALLRNENPASGKRLRARMNTSRQENGETLSNRQVGYGLVFGVPKSLSIYLAITAEQVVENIARSAVDETMSAMEAEMQCKVRKGGLDEDRRTGEMLYSKFFHRDSRPINGLSDPHWHVHCFVHNATFDPVEKRWKAGQFRGLIADKGYFQEYFHTLLVMRLLNNSYSIILTKGHVPGSLDLGQDLLSFSPPHITLGIEIMLGEVLHDSVDQLAHAAEAAGQDRLLAQVSEEAFD